MPLTKKKSIQGFGKGTKRRRQLTLLRKKAKLSVEDPSRPITNDFFPLEGQNNEQPNNTSASKRKLDYFKLQKEENEGTEMLDYAKFFPVDVNNLTSLVSNIPCPMCHDFELKIRPVFSKDLGVVCRLETFCDFCDAIHGTTETSSRLPQSDSIRPPYEVNRRLVTAFLEMGVGYAGMEKFCRIMDMPCLHHKTFNLHSYAIHQASKVSTSKMLEKAASIVRQTYIDINPDLISEDIIDISVSYDGTWLTRGHKSHFGIGACIELLTGLVIDFEVMSSYCHSCENADKDREDYEEWKSSHVCDKNYNGTSGGMEAAAAVIIWQRSIQLHKFRYSVMLSDGDSKTFTQLIGLKVYGADYPIIKEECINHVSKRMGTALRKLAAEKKKEGIVLGGKGYGKLSDTTIQKLTRYYQNAIRANSDNLQNMKAAVFATFLHAISTDDEPHHYRCPTGATSWCFFQRSLANKEIPGPHKLNVRTPLLKEVAEHVLPIYKRLGEDALLGRCLSGKTQNANESLHSVIWNSCPKTHFVHKIRIETAASLAVSKFNSGTSSSEHLVSIMGIKPGKQMAMAGQSKDLERIKKSLKRSTDKYKNLRLSKKINIIKENDKRLQEEGVSYAPGNF